MKFDFDDILLTPELISPINSRKQVNPYDEHGFLPIMTAPMDTVVDESNRHEFINNKIHVVLPRGEASSDYSEMKTCWISYGLEEFKKMFLDTNKFDGTHYALIDVANGHMQKLFDYAKEAKQKYGDSLVLMVGNIANPKTYTQFAYINVDYIRVGIGGGAGCLTSVQTGVGYPMASLIHECSKYKFNMGAKTKIVADGGFRKFADINKALALGADYVMLGSMLNKAIESCGQCYVKNEHNEFRPLNLVEGVTLADYFEKNKEVYKQYRGMSTKEVQKAWGREELKTSEGISKYNKVEYTLAGFVENLEDYLRSAMSYAGSSTLNDFRDSHFELITPAAFKRFDK